MFEKNMRFAFLLDFYSELLDKHTKDIMTAYYEDDLSLAEIADGEGISRQGVRHIIKKGEDELEFFESNLSLAKEAETASDISEKIASVIVSLKAKSKEELSDDIEALESVLKMLSDK